MLQLVVVVDCLALLMFDWGVGYVSSDQLLGCAEANSSDGGIELCGLFGGLVSKIIPWDVHVCRHPGDVDVCWQLLQGSFQGGNLSRMGFTRSWHNALLSVHMRTLEFAGAFSSIQLFDSCSAAISSSIEHVMGLPFAVIVVTTLGASGSPVVIHLCKWGSPSASEVFV